jgi:hypothetical protein
MGGAIPNVWARHTMAALLGDTGSSQTSAVALSAKAKRSNPETSVAATRPLDMVDLSVRAKAMLERNKVDQLVAGRLDELLAIWDGDDPAEAHTKSSDSQDRASKLFDDLFGVERSET